MTEKKIELANKFLFELVYLTHHIENIAYEETKIGGGIFILTVIQSKEECIMKDIVENLNIGPSTATRQVDSLVKEGLIRRKVGEKDRRKVSISLTKEGRKVYERFKTHLLEVMSSSLKIYSEKEINNAMKVFHTIVETSEKNLKTIKLNKKN